MLNHQLFFQSRKASYNFLNSKKTITSQLKKNQCCFFVFNVFSSALQFVTLVSGFFTVIHFVKFKFLNLFRRLCDSWCRRIFRSCHSHYFSLCHCIRNDRTDHAYYSHHGWYFIFFIFFFFVTG